MSLGKSRLPLDHASISLHALPGIPSVQAGDDVAQMLCDALDAASLQLEDSDVLVVTHKILSKAEGRSVRLRDVTPSPEALDLAAATGKEAALVQVILSESRKVLRHRSGLIITEHRLGMVMANAGIDQSNVAGEEDDRSVLLLPEDPDVSSNVLRATLEERFKVSMAVVVSDSVGRAWRRGVVGLALGVSGLPALLDLRGKRDLEGRELKVTEVGLADEIASAAELLMGEADEGRPAVLVRGLRWQGAALPASSLLRDRSEDLFR